MSATPYSDSHAEKVRVVADTYDPDALVVPHRKAMNLELERDEARACLVEAMSFCESSDGTRGTMFGCCVTGYKMARWRKAAGLDPANANADRIGGRKIVADCCCNLSGLGYLVSRQ